MPAFIGIPVLLKNCRKKRSNRRMSTSQKWNKSPTESSYQCTCLKNPHTLWNPLTSTQLHSIKAINKYRNQIKAKRSEASCVYRPKKSNYTSNESGEKCAPEFILFWWHNEPCYYYCSRASYINCHISKGWRAGGVRVCVLHGYCMYESFSPCEPLICGFWDNGIYIYNC